MKTNRKATLRRVELELASQTPAAKAEEIIGNAIARWDTNTKGKAREVRNLPGRKVSRIRSNCRSKKQGAFSPGHIHPAPLRVLSL